MISLLVLFRILLFSPSQLPSLLFSPSFFSHLLTFHPFSFHSYEALAASERKLSESIAHIDETEETISWYSTVLGFHVKWDVGIDK